MQAELNRENNDRLASQFYALAVDARVRVFTG